jgi:hypothetical protein
VRFVPDAEQRLWRPVKRRKYQLTRDRARLQNQVGSLLEEAHIKLCSLVSDLLGASSRRMLKALADGETNPAVQVVLPDKLVASHRRTVVRCIRRMRRARPRLSAAAEVGA